MLNWVSRFNIFCFLDNQSYSMHLHRYEAMLAVGASDSIVAGDVQSLDHFIQKHNSWKFGHLCYELKNQLHGFTGRKEDRIGFPEFHFFIPEVLLLLHEEGLTIHAADPAGVYHEICEQEASSEEPGHGPVSISQKLNKEEYIQKIEKLRQHILRGDCYEINFCQEFFAAEADIDPVQVYLKLSEISPNPFSAFYRYHDSYLACASPERFLARKGKTLISQPIKGTIGRDLINKVHDEKLKNELKQSAKDQAENVMVVDMVRNDLAQVCRDATVKVEELFGIYSFPQVHQMISTISGELKDNITFSQILKASFPMGSMTGAPKIRVMELIDEYEESARGIFSGAVGYMDPENNFDFNVVIRSIIYNAREKYLSYQLGSGITFYSDPEKEWEECLLKGEAIRKVLGVV